MKGIFITFEGGEASGKTTVIKCLVEVLRGSGFEVISTREPGGIEISEQIREVILSVNNTKMTKETESLLYAASRTQHLSEKIIPALQKGQVVVCDRYLDSSLVYQGIARDIGLENILKINTFATEFMPDITFFFDIKPEVALERLKFRDNEINRLDLEKLDFHQKVYDGYKQLAKMYPKRIITVDANKDVNEIVNEVLKKVYAYISNK